MVLVDEATGEVRWDVQAHAGASLATAAMSPDGSVVASIGNLDQHWKLWDAANAVVHRMGVTHDGSGACICGHPLVVQEGCPVLAHTCVPVPGTVPEGITALSFSPCGRRLATAGADNAVILWDAQTGAAEHRMLGRFEIALSFSADGARLASGSRDPSIRVWDATNGALLRTILHPVERGMFCVQFSPTSNRMLAVAGVAQCALWDVDSGERIWIVVGRYFAAFSPDGRTIATAHPGSACDVRLVNAETGELVVSMVGHTGPIYSASFSVEDGSKLASGSADGTCKVWDSSTGALLRTIDVGRLVFSVEWGRDWVRDTQRAEAFAMGHHPWLGAGSQVLVLDEELLRIILGKK